MQGEGCRVKGVGLKSSRPCRVQGVGTKVSILMRVEFHRLPKPYTLHPTSYTLHPTPSTLRPSTHTLEPHLTTTPHPNRDAGPSVGVESAHGHDAKSQHTMKLIPNPNRHAGPSAGVESARGLDNARRALARAQRVPSHRLAPTIRGTYILNPKPLFSR